jgi:NAD(P)H-quinone oxidoreductase subunit 5
VGVILAVSMSQLVLQAATALGLVPALVMAGGMSALLCTTYFVLHAFFDRLLLNSVLPVSGLAHTAYSVLMPVVSVTFVALLMMQQFLQASASPARFRLYVHLYNGLYVDVYVTRLLQKLWPVPQTNDIQLQGA